MMWSTPKPGRRKRRALIKAVGQQQQGIQTNWEAVVHRVITGVPILLFLFTDSVSLYPVLQITF